MNNLSPELKVSKTRNVSCQSGFSRFRNVDFYASAFSHLALAKPSQLAFADLQE